MLWSLHGPSGFHLGDGPSFSYTASTGHKNAPLSRRLGDPGFLPRRLSQSQGHTLKSVQGLEHYIQPGQVSFDSFPKNTIFGHGSRLLSPQSCTDTAEEGDSSTPNRDFFGNQPSASYYLAEATGPSLIAPTSYSKWSVANEVPSMGYAAPVGLSQPRSSNFLDTRNQGRPHVVDCFRQTCGRQIFDNNSARQDALDGCFRRRLGSPSRRSLCLRAMVERRIAALHQHERTHGHREGTQRVCPFPVLPLGSSFQRQYDSPGLSTKPGRHSLMPSKPAGEVDPHLDRAIRRSPKTPICHGQEKCHSGLPLEVTTNCLERVDPTPRGGERPHPQVAGDSRLVRVGPHLQATRLLCTSDRSAECRNRRPTTGLDKSTSIRISSLSDNSSSFKQTDGIQKLSDNINSSPLAPKGMVCRSNSPIPGASNSPAKPSRPPETTACPSVSFEPTRTTSSCVETSKRLAKNAGFSKDSAQLMVESRRLSTRKIYQSRWSVYRKWCKDNNVTSSRPTIPKIADFLTWLHKSRKLSPTSVKGYRSMLASVFHSILPEISSSRFLKDLVRGVENRAVKRQITPPTWDLIKVLDSLRLPPYEPLEQASLRDLSKKTLFLLALATAKRVGELQALSNIIHRQGQHMVLSYLPEFIAKTESLANPLPRTFVLKSLKDFVGGSQDELLLCPVRALEIYLERTEAVVNRPRSLFLSPSKTTNAMSKNALSFFIRETISQGDPSASKKRTHDIRGLSSSYSFWKNKSLTKVLEYTSWKSNTVFTSFYLKDIAHSQGDRMSLGPFLTAGQVVHSSSCPSTSY